MKKRFIRPYSILLTGALLLAGCSATRDLPEDAYMLDKARVVADGKYKDINTSKLQSYVRQKGNARWFSAVKLPLGLYAMAGKDSSWINRTLRSMGEAPVVYDSLLARQTCDDLRLALHNKGYLDADVELFVDKKGKKVTTYYVLHPKDPYYVGDFDEEINDSVIARLLKDKRSKIRIGDRFSVDALNSERQEITSYLQDRGYFRFHKEFVTYKAHRHDEEKTVDVKLILHPYYTRDGKDTLHSHYDIRNITYESGTPGDSTIHLRRHVLEENTFLEAGKPYSASDLQNTYNHFGRLGAVRYTNISFETVPDTTLLDSRILIQTNKPSTISFQPEGTNTAGDLGAAASLTYQNRNLFRGSETFSVQLRGAYEAIKGLEGYKNQDFIEYSIESRLSFPRFIVPFLNNDIRRRIIATSEVSVTFDILRYNYEDLFIMKMGFGYTYNNGRYALKTNVETAGNLLNLSSHIFSAEKNEEGQFMLFGIAYAQYVKGDFEFTRQLLGRQNRDQLVFHFGLGIAYPYGNSSILPFEKRYFSGGANSVRGWSVRSLGPGRYKDKDGRINFITQTGDLKLDLNLEYRTHLFWKFAGALFVDAGNIWTLRDYKDQPGGQFKISSFLDDIAFSYGLGLRLNFDYFILRFDLGMKAINPAYKTEEEDHFPLLHPRLSRDLAFHFAVGMPF